MNWIAWTRDEINEFETMGIDLLWTELDDYGFVTRELGFDIEGRVIHKVPFGSNRFGLFDLQIITVSGITPFIELERFNERWCEADDKLLKATRKTLFHPMVGSDKKVAEGTRINRMFKRLGLWLFRIYWQNDLH